MGYFSGSATRGGTQRSKDEGPDRSVRTPANDDTNHDRLEGLGLATSNREAHGRESPADDRTCEGEQGRTARPREGVTRRTDDGEKLPTPGTTREPQRSASVGIPIATSPPAPPEGRRPLRS